MCSLSWPESKFRTCNTRWEVSESAQRLGQGRDLHGGRGLTGKHRHEELTRRFVCCVRETLKLKPAKMKQSRFASTVFIVTLFVIFIMAGSYVFSGELIAEGFSLFEFFLCCT
jgi:hypothetical protein